MRYSVFLTYKSKAIVGKKQKITVIVNDAKNARQALTVALKNYGFPFDEDFDLNKIKIKRLENV